MSEHLVSSCELVLMCDVAGETKSLKEGPKGSPAPLSVLGFLIVDTVQQSHWPHLHPTGTMPS